MAKTKQPLETTDDLGQEVADNMPVRKEQCATCVFRPECDGGIHLSPGRRAEIQEYVIKGTNQICHHDDNKTICRGGRDYQLELWYRMGIIKEPNEEALAEAMKAAGVEPKKHILSKPRKRSS
jgi:hypothetical protein